VISSILLSSGSHAVISLVSVVARALLMCLCVVLVSKSEVFFALLKIMTGGPRNNCRLSEIQYGTAEMWRLFIRQ